MQKMKYLLLISMIALWGCKQSQNVITVKGHVEFDEPGQKMEIFRYENNEKVVYAQFDIDQNNHFNYQFTVEHPGVYTLSCKKWEQLRFWAEDEDVEVHFRGKDTAKVVIKMPVYHPILSTGPNNELMNQYNYIQDRNYRMMVDMSQLIYKTEFASPEDKQQMTMDVYKKLNEDLGNRMVELAERNYKLHSIVALLSYLKEDKNKALLDKIYTEHKDYQPVQQYKKDKEIAAAKAAKVEIGQVAPDFSYRTEDSTKTVSLKDFRGKYLLIDFWASWCGPCRAEVPNLKKTYKEFAGKDVAFLSVSIDAKEADWKKALLEEQMDWPQVLAPNAGKEIMQEYQFSGIPFIILLDKEGKIVAKHLRGGAIGKKLREVLNNK